MRSASSLLPCKLFSSTSIFLNVALTSGTVTGGPVDSPLALSINWMRTWPISSGDVSSTASIFLFLRMFAGGGMVAILGYSGCSSSDEDYFFTPVALFYDIFSLEIPSSFCIEGESVVLRFRVQIIQNY